MKNQVQLITYVDRLGGGGLPALLALLEGPLRGLFGGVHLLPFFDPIDGTDAGFDPIDHTRVDPRLGDWSDVAALAKRVDVMADVIVNHMSSESPQFLDFSARGDASPFQGLFMTMATVFPDGASESELLALYRPRPGLPFTVKRCGGAPRLMWTTFGPQQIDINVQHPHGRAYLETVLRALASDGVSMIRLDAVGYAIKTAGTSCFMTEETFAFIDGFSGLARSLGLQVLVEVHAHHRTQIEIARRVDWVYDFALPPLVLHAFFFKTAAPMERWLALRPANAITVLDTHDGIGIIDIGAAAGDEEERPGLVPPAELAALVERIHANSKGQSRQATGAAASNLDLYQVNCSFYAALGENDLAYLLARAIQFFMPGIPQVYYVGLLAGGNDIELLHRSGVGRDINRHRYLREEVERETQRPVVSKLFELIRLRNTHPAFAGTFLAESRSDSELVMAWSNGEHAARLRVDFDDMSHEIAVTGGECITFFSDLTPG